MANAEETVVPIPVIVEPIEVELTPVVVVPQFGDIAVQVDLGDRAPCTSFFLCHQYSKFLKTLSYLYSLPDLVVVRRRYQLCLFWRQPKRYIGNNRNHCHSDLFCLRPTCLKP